MKTIPEDKQYDDLINRLSAVLPTLTEREQEVLTLRFGLADGNSRTLREIAQKFKVSPETIRRCEIRGLRKMRDPNRINAVLDRDAVNSFIPEDIQVIDLVEAEKTLTPFLISHLKMHTGDLLKVNPAVFEHLIGEFFASWGFEDVRLVGTDKNTAADIFALKKINPDQTEIRYFIETKRWKDTVGITIINSVLGAVGGERDQYGWNIGMIVTASKIADTHRYANLEFKGIHLRSGDKVIEWLLSYQPNKNGLWLPKPLRTMDGLGSNNRLQSTSHYVRRA